MGEAQKMRLAKRLAFLGFDLIFGIVKGEELNSLRGEWSPEVGRGIRNTPPYLWPARSAKPFDRKRKHPPRHRRERQQYTCLIHAIFENCDKLL